MILPLVLSAVAALSLPGPPCAFEGEPREWTAEALENWARLDRARIGMANPATPTMVLFDQTCTYRFTPDANGDFRAGGRAYSVRGDAHHGEIGLPHGGTIPPRKLSFASPTEDGGMFFAMALPDLWRADTRETRDPDRLAMVVFMHEFAHTQQGEGLGRMIDSLIARGLPEEANDDTLQETWGANPDYVAAYEAERDLLYDAAEAGDAARRQALLAQAAAGMQDRRARFLSDQPLWREADDLFLTLEGSGNWAAWVWLTDPHGGALSDAEATAFIRGARRWWSQDAGLGLMLALDGLTPDWPRLSFGPEATTADSLVARALQRPSRSSE